MSTHVVYRALDSRDRVLYVGATSHFAQRQAEHAITVAWYPRVTQWITEGPYSQQEAYAIEAQMIRDLDPIFNVVHTGHTPLRGRRGIVVRRAVLNAYREARGLSVRALAARVGVTHAAIGHLASGSRSTTTETTAKAIAEALDCPFEAMFQVERQAAA